MVERRDLDTKLSFHLLINFFLLTLFNANMKINLIFVLAFFLASHVTGVDGGKRPRPTEDDVNTSTKMTDYYESIAVSCSIFYFHLSLDTCPQ